MNLTIVIPTYNEAENIPRIIPALFSLPIPDLRILIVDDNSPDGTAEIAEEQGKINNRQVEILKRPGKMGLGSAYIQGFQKAIAAGADAICQMDADFSHPVEKIPEMFARLAACDAVSGSRYIPGGSVDERWSFWRKWLSSFGNFYARNILSLNIKDVTGGFRIWKSTTLSALPLKRVRSNGYVFQVEMAYITQKLGFRMEEVPFYFADRRWGKSKMSLRISLEAALRVWQLPGLYADLK